MCANLFSLIRNSSPDSNPPRAEENNRTSTVETAVGLSRGAQSGVRCALLHGTAYSVHAQQNPAHTHQWHMNTLDRVISTRQITAHARITSPKPHVAYSTRERTTPESLQWERQLCPEGLTHQSHASGASASPDEAPAPHKHGSHTATASPRRTQQHADLRKTYNSTPAVTLRTHAGTTGKIYTAPHSPRVGRERQAHRTLLDPAPTARAYPDRPPKHDLAPGGAGKN